MKTRSHLRLASLALWVGSLFLSWVTQAANLASVATAEAGAPLATIQILAPKDGAIVAAPGPILIEAEAIDLKGDIRHLDFYANDKLIGTSDYLLKIATIPGRPIPHTLEWTNVAPGSYKLVARGTNTVGEVVDSPSVAVEVRERSDAFTWVSLEATVAVTSEPSPTIRIIPGELTVRRTGPTTLPLVVYLSYSGTAKNGVDYEELPPTVTIPAGKSEAVLTVFPVDDDLVEDTETVVARVEPVAVPQQLPSYGIDGRADRSEVAIRDSDKPAGVKLTLKEPADGASFRWGTAIPVVAVADGFSAIYKRVEFFDGDQSIGVSEFPDPIEISSADPSVHRIEWLGASVGTHVLTARGRTADGLVTETPPVQVKVLAPEQPRIAITSPVMGAAFESGSPITIKAIAIDPKGYISRVEFFDGDTRIGVSEIVFIRAPDPGTPIQHAFDWEGAAVGSHKIHAVAAGADGAKVVSEAVVITVTGLPPRASLVLNAPKNGAEFLAGQTIPMVATATLAGGTISQVEFLDGDTVVGVAELPKGVLWIPGNSHQFTFEWTNPPVGEHKLGARAVLPNDAVLVSDRVLVRVLAPTKPVLLIREPANGAKFSVGEAITIRAVAVDPKGYISRVSFFDGEQVIGVSELTFIRAPDPGTPIEHTFIWKGAKAGQHKLQAAAVGTDRTTVVSDVVLVTVGEASRPPTLVINTPKPGAEFIEGLPIEIAATATDPLDYIPRVEFFDGDDSIGVSELAFLVAPPPGTPIHHSLTWVGARLGAHKLRAKAVTSAGVAVVSSVVPVTVTSATANQVVLDVVGFDGDATEPAGHAAAKSGRFRIYRTSGEKQVAVAITIKLGGEAVNGIDYEKVPENLVLPKGAEHLDVVIKPIADKAKEGDEKVVLTLVPTACIAIFPPPPECYRIGTRSEAAVVIHDGEPANAAPKVAITAPKSGLVVMTGDPIVVKAEASDADGSVVRLDILADGKLLGSTKLSTLAVDWKEATRGIHKLTAKALDDAGKETTSSVVVVYVRDVTDLAFVTRDLPAAYLPGAIFDVTLKAAPTRSGNAWAVEDAPPAGWAVSSVSHDGTWDPVAGKVRFGPFTDRRDRRLTYKVTPASDAKGVQKFVGTTSLDGRALPILGDDTIGTAGEFHPADANPADHVITMDELTAYASAWRTRKTWGAAGDTIPASYVTRAALIWAQGGKYAFDATKGAPPACWVSVRAAALANDAGRPGIVGPAAAIRRSFSLWTPGVPAEIIVSVNPPSGTKAVCVEETVPADWVVTQISDEGVFDAEHRQIRWGVFLGDTPRELRYTITPPSGVASNGTFDGVACFDDERIPVGGVIVVGAADAASAVRIASTRRADGGRVYFQVEALADQVLAVEASSDLTTWTEVGAFVHTGDEVELVDPTSQTVDGRYYRVRPVGR